MVYNVVPISAGLVAIYLVSWGLTKAGKLAVATHRKLWNALLLITFSVAAVSAMLIAVRADLGLRIITFENSFWHGQFGVAAIMIAAFHALWHISYFQAYFAGLFKKKEAAK